MASVAISGAQLVYPDEHNSNSTPANCEEPIDAAPELEITRGYEYT